MPPHVCLYLLAVRSSAHSAGKSSSSPTISEQIRCLRKAHRRVFGGLSLSSSQACLGGDRFLSRKKWHKIDVFAHPSADSERYARRVIGRASGCRVYLQMHPFSQRFLCLSRACLGKYWVYQYKSDKKDVLLIFKRFHTRARRSLTQAWPGPVSIRWGYPRARVVDRAAPAETAPFASEFA
jgi:hypothetical protein